jgi:hypothetical protein
MTQEEIKEMAKEVYGDTNWTEASLSRLEALIKLAIAAEREACAKLVGEFAQNYSAYELATIIRARGQA